MANTNQSQERAQRAFADAADEAARQMSAGVPANEAVAAAADQYGLPRDARDALLTRASAALAPWGPLAPLLEDGSVRDIAVNGPRDVWVLQSEGWARTDVAFRDESELRSTVERLLTYGDTRQALDRANPVVDARLTLPPRPRVCATISPASDAAVTLTIRKYMERNLSLVEMASPRYGTMSREMATTLYAAVIAGLNIVVSGGTGSGKTTILNALVAQVPVHERLVVIEDTAEVRLERGGEARANGVRLMVDRDSEVRSADALLRASLRMSPNRIVLGEVRGREALTMLAAMNTGHDGSLATIHASGALEALGRLEGLCLMAAGNIGPEAIRGQIGMSVDLVIQAARTDTGQHVVSEIVELERGSASLRTRQLFRREPDGTFVAPEPPARWDRLSPFWPVKLMPPWPGVAPLARPEPPA